MDDRTLLRIVLIISIASLAATSAVLVEMRGGSGTAAPGGEGASPPANYGNPCPCSLPTDCDRNPSRCEDCTSECGDDESCFSSCKRCVEGCYDGDTICYEMCIECVRPCNGDEECYSICEGYRPRFNPHSGVGSYYIGTFKEIARACDHDNVCIERCIDELGNLARYYGRDGAPLTCLSRPESTG